MTCFVSGGVSLLAQCLTHVAVHDVQYIVQHKYNDKSRKEYHHLSCGGFEVERVGRFAIIHLNSGRCMYILASVRSYRNVGHSKTQGGVQ